MERVTFSCLLISTILHYYTIFKLMKLEKRIDLLENKRLKGD